MGFGLGAAMGAQVANPDKRLSILQETAVSI